MASEVQTITNKTYQGERALYASKNLKIDNCTFDVGESALKESSNIECNNCKFVCKYIMWHDHDVKMDNCLLTIDCRAPIWYTKNVEVKNTIMENPKTFRECDGVTLDNVQMNAADEFIWSCRNVTIKNSTMREGKYAFLHCDNVTFDNFDMVGNYAFQYTKNMTIRNSKLTAKDSFWHSENVTIYDSEISGEYLAWYSKNVKLVNCKISGTQPFCYAENLVLENCTMDPSCDLAFEYTTVNATIIGNVASIKNPLGGSISCDSCTELILDENCRNKGECQITIKDKHIFKNNSLQLPTHFY